MKSFKKQTIYLVIIIILAGIAGWISLKDKNLFQIVSVTNFQECVTAGYPVQESYPERCITPDGKSFTNLSSITPRDLE